MNQINFLPDGFLKHRQRENRRPIEFAVIGFTVIALVALWLYAGGPDSALAHRASVLDQQLAQAQDQKAVHAQLIQQRDHLQRKLLIARETHQPIGVTQVLARLSQLSPEPVRLLNLELVTDRPDPDPVPDPKAADQKVVASRNAAQDDTTREPNVMRITLSGLAPSDEQIVALIRALDREPVFTSVALRNSRMTQTKTHIAREFKLDLTIDLDRRFVPVSGEEQPDED